MSGDRSRGPHGRWATFVARVRQVRKRPLLILARSLLSRIPFDPLDVNCLYLLEYVGVPAQHSAFIRGRAEIRSATLQDLDELAACQGDPSGHENTRRTFLKRFKANDACAVAVLDGRIIAYRWICTRPFYMEERYACKIHIPPDAVYAYDIFIRPEYRVTGLWLKFHTVSLRDLMLRLQRNRILGLVDYGNRLAMNTLLRYGFQIVKQIFVFRIFGQSISMTRPFRHVEAVLPGWIGPASIGRARGHRRAAASRVP